MPSNCDESMTYRSRPPLPCSTRMTMRLLTMSATLMPAASEARNAAAYDVVSAPRAFRRGAGLQARHRLQEAHNLIGSQHYRQFARCPGIRDPLWQVGLFERDAIQKAKGADGLFQRRPRHPTSDQMHLEGANVLQVKILW